MDESSEKKPEDTEDNSKKADTDDSLTLSMTPPLPFVEDNTKDNNNSYESISEHLTSNSGSIENDRSYQEIEISNRPMNVFLNVDSSDEERQKQTSFCSNNSIISLNYLDTIDVKNMEVRSNVRSILEEILNNEQFESGSEAPISIDNSKDESLNIFANIDLDDKSLSNFRTRDDSLNEKNFFGSNFAPLLRHESDVDKRIKDFEMLIAVKDSTIAALTSELDSFREMSNTNSTSIVSTTEYKQLQEECHNKLLEYNSAIIYKNDLIQQLSESLDQSISERRELLTQVDFFKDEISQLQKQLQDTTKLVNEHECIKENKHKEKNLSDDSKKEDVDKGQLENSEFRRNLQLNYSDLEESLNVEQKSLFNSLKMRIDNFVKESVAKDINSYKEEISKLKEKITLDKEDYETEITRLRDLLANIKCGSTEIMELKNQLEAKHSREMEELRTYFEKKCTDLEKNYSEEIFSQQSRKMSDSTCSDAELNSDLLFSHPPGPDGDMRLHLEPNLTKKDLTNLKNELNSILDKINKYNLDCITDEDFGTLKSEIGNCNLNNLLKYDLALIKSELRNAYHAELEVMREDNENRIDVLNVEHETSLRSLEGKYFEEMENLKCQLDDMTRQNISISSAVQEVASSGEFEITEVIQSYERRLQEQVTLAKIDIISALESQIQRLAANETDDEEWPSELLRLRDRFSDKYENKMKEMEEEHQKELDKLKDEHIKILNGALERARRRSLRDNDSLSKSELEILKERDNLRKQVSSLRNLLGELLKYFTQCEDELNSTLVDELLKQAFDKNITQIEEELNLNDSSTTNSSKTADSTTNITRVHLAPNFSDLINLIESSSQEDRDSRDISLDLKNELDICLEKLKQEANTILALTTNMPKQGSSHATDSPRNVSLEEKLSSLTRQLINEAQAKKQLKDELNEAMSYVASLENEKDILEKELDEVIAKVNILEGDLLQARSKIAELIENGHKEVVSEGYGEKGGTGLHELGDTMTVLNELQEKARIMLGQSRKSADPTLCHLIEELCTVGEKIKEESQKERLDLMQQIDAADKKYRTTHKFLEDQAAERELERDEAQKRIDQLCEQLRERDRDRANCERYTAEVDQLDQQLQDMTRLLADEAKKCKEVEDERNEAIEKIKVLRDIIRDLEQQTELKTKEVNDCLDVIQKLECIVDQQHRSINELRQNDSLKEVSDIQSLQKHIENLECELQQSRVNSELAGSEGALRQINTQLSEFETTLDKKTKELEFLHSTETNCSSPSEDISARDVIRPRSPNMTDDCEVPLQQLARLKEKLVRHSRAEDAAIKRIRDLEMQVFSLKNELEETNNEKGYMKKQVQEHLVLISDFQIRLDEQRIRADHIEKQTNTSLELKIYDLQNEIVSLREKLENKNKFINNQQMLLNDTQNRLKALENELNSPKEDEFLIAMQRELEMLRKENAQMKNKINHEAQIVPNLVENIISDKNIDIEKLREKLQETEKLLETYTSLNLDRGELQALSNLKHSGTSIEEVLSIIDLSMGEQVRKMESRNEGETLNTTEVLAYKRNINETALGSSSEPEISNIEKVGPYVQVHVGGGPSFWKPNSTEIKSLERRVHFEDSIDIEKLRSEVATLRGEIESKENIIKGYEERLSLLSNLEEKIEKLQLSLEETEKALANATETFEKEQRDLRETEKNLGVQLAETKMHLSEKEKRIEVLERDSIRKDETCMNLTREKKELERALSMAKHESYKNLDAVIKEKNSEIEKLQLGCQDEELQSLQHQLEDKNMEAVSLQTEKEYLQTHLEKLKSANSAMKQELQHSNEENVKLRKELQNNTVQIESVTTEMSNLKEKVNKKRRAIKELEDTIQKQQRSLEEMENKIKRQQEIIVDRECEIEIANEDMRRYQNDLTTLEDKISELEKGGKLSNEVEKKVEQLEKEKLHLQDLLNEKDKIINQISDDSHKLHVNLVTIQAKLKETGNIIDLGNKLKEEQKRTAELVEEIHELKAQLLQYEMAKKSGLCTDTVDEITDQVKRELDYSAQIDSNIISAIGDQSLGSISDSQDVETYKKALSEEKATRKRLTQLQERLKNQLMELEDKCSRLQSTNEDLQHSLTQERLQLQQTREDDAKLIEQLRVQLDVVLDHEEAVRRMLDEEKATRAQLDSELEELRRKTAYSSGGASKTESTEYKDLPGRDTAELNRLRRELETARGEKAALTNEVKLLEMAKKEMQKGYEYAREMLNVEVQKGRGLEDKVRGLVQIEKELRESLSKKKAELEEKLREIEERKAVMDEMEQEKAHLNKQKQELIQRLKAQTLNEAQTGSTSPVPDILLSKIKELNNALLDNKKLIDLIQKISNEKRGLESELVEIKGRRSTNLPFDDLVARSDYLFAKTLRLESTKKALIWQKRYLLDYLQGHQRHCLVEALPHTMPYRNEVATRMPKERFRTAVIVIISIVRMKYLVRRWHSGIRIAENVNSRHYNRHLSTKTQKVATKFKVGQPVSSQWFSSNVGTQFNATGPRNLFVHQDDSQEDAYGFYDDGRVSPASSRHNTPWSGNTPPSKDVNNKNRIRIGSTVVSREDMTPLKAPQLLAQFVERFDQIQEKLGVALDTNAT